MYWSTPIFFILIFTYFILTTNASSCPKPSEKEVCENNQLIKFSVRFRPEKHGCEKEIKREIMPINCPIPRYKLLGKCIKGYQELENIQYKIDDCKCIQISQRLRKPCGTHCPPPQTIRNGCVKGRRRVISRYFVRDNDKCIIKLHEHYENCLNENSHQHFSEQKGQRGCHCYIYAYGHVISHDGLHIRLPNSPKCQYLLAAGNKRQPCEFHIYANMKNGQTNSISLFFQEIKYTFANEKRLFVNDKIEKVPYEGKNVRIFYSGEFIQFVALHCQLAIGFNGYTESYIYVNHNPFDGKMNGACGDCNGSPKNDRLTISKQLIEKCSLGNESPRPKCHDQHDILIGMSKRFCGGLHPNNKDSFFRCPKRKLLKNFYKSCLQDYCAYRGFHIMQRRVTCRIHSMAAEACAEHGLLPRWRRRDFCPISCGEKQKYVSRMNPCPITCESHFFGTERRCFKLPQRDGCQCLEGYVLDGSQCVKPTECHCLDSICIDRYDKKRCLAWKKMGKCDQFPRLMSEFCRLTCGICKAECHDQMSEKRCFEVKEKGLCKIDFYEQMCRLTCNPYSCECPKPVIRKSQCHPSLKIRKIQKLFYQSENNGKCTRLLKIAYEKCADCKTGVFVHKSKCDFCRRELFVTRLVRYREVAGRFYCHTVKSKKRLFCGCPTSKKSHIVCLNDDHLIRQIFQYFPQKDCQGCAVKKSSKSLKKIDCHKRWSIRGKCHSQTGVMRVIDNIEEAHDCQCKTRQVVRFVQCSCDEGVRVMSHCHHESSIERIINTIRFHEGKCIQNRRVENLPVSCDKRPSVKTICDRRTCKATQLFRFYNLINCKCVLAVKKKEVGVCCCPPDRLMKGQCINKVAKIELIYHTLVNFACIKHIKQRQIDCGCGKRKTRSFCIKEKGIVVEETTYSYLKHERCKHFNQKKEIPIVCSEVHQSVESACSEEKNQKYQIKITKQLIRDGCKCKWTEKVHKEPCQCVLGRGKELFEYHPCPQQCMKECSDRCHQSKNWFTMQESEDGKKCIKKLIIRKVEPCCCPHIHRRHRTCHKGSLWLNKEEILILNHKKCVWLRRKTMHRVACPVPKRPSTFGPKQSDGKVKLIHHNVLIKNCQCHAAFVVDICRWKCPPPRVMKFCDKLINKFVTRTHYYDLNGCQCNEKEKVREEPIKCRKRPWIVKKYCDEKMAKETIVLAIEKLRDCQCKRMFVKKFRRCGCPQPKVVRSRCNPHRQVHEHVIKEYDLRDGHCHPVLSIRRDPIQCDHKISSEIVCHKDSGILQEIIISFVPKMCRCRKQVEAHKKGYCHCKSKSQPKHTQFCDEKTQEKVRVMNIVSLSSDGSHCKNHQRVKKFSIECPRPTNQHHHCDLTRGLRQIDHVMYKKFNCKCHRFVKTVHEPCGCKKAPKELPERHFCNRIRGELVISTRRWVWNEEAEKCIEEEKTRVKPLNCHQRVEVIRSKCKKGKYQERIIRYQLDTKHCACVPIEKLSYKDCRCPTKVIVERCSHESEFSKLIIIERHYSRHEDQCHSSSHSTILKRCRCQLPYKRVKCKSGWKILQKNSFFFKKNNCHREIREIRLRQVCPKKERFRSSRCNHSKGCYRIKIKYILIYNPKNCHCVWKPVAVKKCKCCGCPKRMLKTRCINDRVEESLVTYFTLDWHKCTKDCEEHTTRLLRSVECPKSKLPPSHWTSCDKRSCKKKLIRFVSMIKHCRCFIKKVMDIERDCCCPEKPSTEAQCIDGKILINVHVWQLRHYKCVPHKITHKKEIKCEQPDHPIVHSECDRQTCQQMIYLIKRVVSRHDCKCKEIRILHDKEQCCCPSKGLVKKRCEGPCMVTSEVEFSFDAQHKTCIKHVEFNRQCKRCPKPYIRKHPCDPHRCFMKEEHYSFIIRHCQCHRVVETRVRQCCCPPPTPPSSICDQRHGQIREEKIVFHLKNDQCARQKLIKVINVQCQHKQGPIKIIEKSCSKETCKALVLFIFRQRVGCDCKQRIEKRWKNCCCPRMQESMECIDHRRPIKKIIHFHLDGEKCVAQKQMLSLPIVHCRERLHHGRCDRTTQKRIDILTIFSPHNCACRKVDEKRFHKKCLCPPPKFQTGHCDAKSCIRIIHKKIFTLSKDHSKCETEIFKKEEPCCCQGPEMWKKVSCISERREILIEIFQRKFDQRNKKCEILVKKDFQSLNCHKHSKVRSKSKCDLKTGFYEDVKEFSEFDHKTCKCQRHQRKRKILCACQHLPCFEKPVKCLDGNYLLVEKVCHELRNEECVKFQMMKKEKIVCPKHRSQSQRCATDNSCHGIIMTKWFEKHNCRCIEKRHVERIRCCCPKPEIFKRCLNNEVLLIKKRFFLLSNDRRTCIENIQKRVLKIHCRKNIVKHEPCDRSTCLEHKIIHSEKSHNCRCVNLKPKLLKRKCCCPHDRSTTMCYNKYNMIQHVRYKYQLYQGECIIEKKVVQSRIACPPPIYSRMECDPKTKKRFTSKLFFEMKLCRCHRKKIVLLEFCACARPSILKEPCRPDQDKRVVMRISWDLRGDHKTRYHCVKKIEKVDEEPCRCPPTSVKKICLGRKVLFKKVKFQLISHPHRQACVIRKSEKFLGVRCPPRKRRQTPCQDNVRKVFTTFYQIINCQCQPIRQMKQLACECWKLNSKRKYCEKNVLFYKKKVFYPANGSNKNCIADVKKDTRPIVCSMKKTKIPLDRDCNRVHHDGFYREYLLTWQELHNCKCVTKQKKITQLCHCAKSKRSEQCIGDDTVRIYQYIFLRDNQRCLPRQEALSKEIRCDKAEREIIQGKCIKMSDNKCQMTITVVENFVKDCRCKRREIRFQRVCCVPSQIVQHLCDNARGLRIKKTTTFDLEPAKILYQADDVQIDDYNVVRSVNVEHQEITCPEPEERVHCDRKSGRWTKKIVTFYHKNCHCKQRVLTLVGQCQCPSTKTIVGPCRDYYREMTRFFFELIDYKCVRHTRRWRQRCQCPPPIPQSYCDNKGHWVKCHTTFILNKLSHSCRLIKDCIRKRHRCPNQRIEESKCHPTRHMKEVTQFEYLLDHENCRCLEKRRFWREYCSCDHLNKQVHQCLKGVILTSHLIHNLREGECIPTDIRKKRLVECPKKGPKIWPCEKRVDAKYKGFQLMRIYKWNKEDCECKPRHEHVYIPCDCGLIHPPRERFFCKKDDEEIKTIIVHILKHGKCLEKLIHKPRRIVCEHQLRIHKSRCQVNPDGVGEQTITLLKHQPRHCKCLWLPVKRHKKICSCPDKRMNTGCKDDQVVIKTLTTFRVNEHHSACLAQHHPSVFMSIKCPEPKIKELACDEKTCQQKVFVFSHEKKNCHCHERRQTKLITCCCPPPTKPQRFCEHNGRQIREQWFSYSLFKHENHCRRRIHEKVFVIHCERKKPLIMMGKCEGEWRNIQFIFFQTKNCECEKRIQNTKELCGCPKEVKHVIGHCHGDWLTEKWIGLKFLKEEKKCIPVVVEERKRRCRCPKAIEKQKCVEDNLLKIIFVSFRLRTDTYDCEKDVKQEIRSIECPIQEKLVGVIHGKCDRETDFFQTDQLQFIVARQCKCVRFNRIDRWPCNCAAIYPPKIRTRCIKDKIAVKIIMLHINKGKKCDRQVKKEIIPIKCGNVKRVKRGECDLNGGTKRWIYIESQVSKDCNCVWEVESKHIGDCLCLKPIVLKKCIENFIIEDKSIVSELVQDHCKRKEIVRREKVFCPSKVVEHRSECNQFTGYQIHTVVKHEIHQCQCLKNIRKRQCKCVCGEPERFETCDPKYGIKRLVTVRYHLNDCRCMSTRQVKTIRVNCESPVIQSGHCQLMQGPYKDEWRIDTHILFSRIECQCQRDIRKLKILCSCDPNLRKQHLCIHNNIRETILTKRDNINGRCEKVIVKKHRENIECDKTKVTHSCNVHTGKKIIVVERSFVRNCICHRKVKTFERAMCKCNEERRLFRRYPCNKNCVEKHVFTFKKLQDEQCVPQYSAVERRCCCPFKPKISHHCIQDEGISETRIIKLRLKKGECVEHEERLRKHIHCEKEPKSYLIRLAGGILKKVHTIFVRIGCKCRRKERFELSKWKCPMSHQRKRCVTVPEAAIEETVYEYRMLHHKSGCERIVKVRRIPIQCPDDRRSETPCHIENPRDYALVRFTIITEHRINDKCQCYPIKRKIAQICECDKQSVRNFCDKKKQVLVRIHTSYSRDSHTSGTRCIKKRLIKKIKIDCDEKSPPVLIDTKPNCKPSEPDGLRRYLQTWVKVIQQGCRCIKIKKKIPCLCEVPKAQKIFKCHHDGLQEEIIIEHKRSGCNSFITKRFSRQLPVHCPKAETIAATKCNYENCQRKLLTIVYEKHKCQCVKRKINQIAKCCCPKSYRTRQCDKIENKIVTFFIDFDLQNGECKKTIRQVHRPIDCDQNYRLKVQGPCLENKQKYLLIKTVKHDCGCRTIRNIVFKKCLCTRQKKADIVFLLDESVGSRYGRYSQHLSEFLKNSIILLPLSSSIFRVALVKYSLQPTVALSFQDNESSHEFMVKAIERLPFSGQHSNLGRALRLVRMKLFAHKRRGVDFIIFLVTDGLNNQPHRTIYEALQLHKLGADIEVIAVKPSRRSEDVLRKIASKEDNFIALHKIKDMVKISRVFTQKLCGNDCPPPRKSILPCSHESGCKGRELLHTYRFDERIHQCIRQTGVHEYTCCCLHPPKKVYKCVDGKHLLLRQIIWQFHKGKCLKTVREDDHTEFIKRKCHPKLSRSIGNCHADGRISIKYERKYFSNCRCQREHKWRHGHCRCPKNRKVVRCEKGGTKLLIVKNNFELKDFHCILRKIVEVKPIQCPEPQRQIDKCDKFTCKQIVRHLEYFVKDCHCHKEEKIFKKTCCCLSNRITRLKKCVEHNVELVLEKWHHYNLITQKCESRIMKKKVSVVCENKPKSRRLGLCGIHRADRPELYHLVEVIEERAIECQCKLIRKNRQEICGCKDPLFLHQCKRGKKITWKISFYLHEKHGRCIRRQSLIEQKRIECPKHHKIEFGPCDLKKRFAMESDSRTDEQKIMEQHFRKVFISEFHNNKCDCVIKKRVSLELCACPRPSKRYLCMPNDVEFVFIKTYKLISMPKEMRKICVPRIEKKTNKLHCPDPKFYAISKCFKNHLKMKVILFELYKCKCRKKTYVRIVPCKEVSKKLKPASNDIVIPEPNPDGLYKKILIPRCMDLLPRDRCILLERRPFSICDRPGRLRDVICRQTCKRCFTCHPKDMSYNIVYKSCLGTDQRYKRRYLQQIIQNKPYGFCRQVCHHHPDCMSFDYHVSHGKFGTCVLSRVDLLSLQNRIFPQSPIDFVSRDLLANHKSVKCFLSIKTCKPKCAPTKMKLLSPCLCLKFNHNKMPNSQHCRQRALILFEAPDNHGECRGQQWEGDIPCDKHACHDLKPKPVCLEIKRSGRCHDKRGHQDCYETCHECRCNGMYEYKGRCNRHSKREDTLVKYQRHPGHGLCAVSISKLEQYCAYCQEGTYRAVHPCRHGKRKITTVSRIRRSDGSCDIRTRQRTFLCKGCNPHDIQIVTSCNHGELSLVTLYSMHDPIRQSRNPNKPCCRLFRETRLFPCRGCPPNMVTQTPCSYGYRLRHVFYHVRVLRRSSHNGRPICIRQVVTRREKCRPIRNCDDSLSFIDCKNFRNARNCITRPKEAKILCPETCGLC